ncbi:TetR/AcrR family transcriptional regulator [Sporolactobacillus shoreicorticis]|uniref:TetR/AcrR family transcriptional regulator n=1 Tax=Sporolactobacillus shoreicorticis TaxID=1923877 RepID=A0ABW5S768_9BACL|nr:TetR/AcrR family transcriptional regulator [Sporolactobacillus shoreicorticis]MCO7125524.1 TetR/AcrR family transcriptional regulator [Sporolactobacillus shoreicorticis]
MDGYKRRAEKTKERIKKAASEQFAVFGAEKVTMRDIAAKANVSPVTVYKYFDNKDVLLEQMLDDFAKGVNVFFDQLLSEELPFPEKINKVFQYTAKKKKIFNDNYFKKLYYAHSENVQQTNERYLKPVNGKLVQLIEQGKAEHYVDSALSEKSIFFFMQMLIDTFSDQEKAMAVDESMRIDLTQIFFYGLAGPGRFKRAERAEG